MKKIVISLNSAWAAYNFRADLAKELQKNDYEVIFVVPRDEYFNKLNEKFLCEEIEINNTSKNPLKDMRLTYCFYKIYRKISPDIILHFNIKANIYGTLAAHRLNIPTINNIAGLGTLFEKETFFTKIAKKLYKISQKKATKVFFQNNDDYNLFVEQNIVCKTKCSILPGSGVNTSRFHPSSHKQSDTFKLLLAARLLRSKGVGEYVEAARIIRKKHDNIEFQILGFLDFNSPSAITEEEMNKWREEGIINYIGTSDSVENEIANVDCVVLPSYYREGVPKILLEALSMGKPIITTNSVGCREVVDHEINGYLCKIKDSIDLAHYIEKLFLLPKKARQNMGKMSRKKALLSFDEKIVFTHYLDSIKESIKK